MKTIIKLCVFVLTIFSFTACFPVMMTHRDGDGYGRRNYYNRGYYSGREYRQSRRNRDVEVRINAGDNDDRRYDR